MYILSPAACERSWREISCACVHARRMESNRGVKWSAGVMSCPPLHDHAPTALILANCSLASRAHPLGRNPSRRLTLPLLRRVHNRALPLPSTHTSPQLFVARRRRLPGYGPHVGGGVFYVYTYIHCDRVFPYTGRGGALILPSSDPRSRCRPVLTHTRAHRRGRALVYINVPSRRVTYTCIRVHAGKKKKLYTHGFWSKNIRILCINVRRCLTF